MLPLLLVTAVSLVIGLLMVLLFGYTSDQKAIKVAKDQLKAHLLAVRLFQDQLPVVVGSYGRIIRGTGRYIRLAFMPLLYVIVPITLLIVQIDRYLGQKPFAPEQAFLVKATAPGALDSLSLDLPEALKLSAPPLHIPGEYDIMWRVVGDQPGVYDVFDVSGDLIFPTRVVVSGGVERLSPARFRDHFWERLFTSAEPALPGSSPVDSIAVNYPSRDIRFAWIGWNWIVLFFVLSMIAGFAFKEILGIEI